MSGVPSDAWKRHERYVAEYFGTKRRLRGADFSQSDVEVKTSLLNWLGRMIEDVGVVVECKYRKTHDIISYVSELDPQTGIFVASLDGYLLCWLEDFKDIFQDWLWKNSTGTIEAIFGHKYNMVTIDRQAPKFLAEYALQARQYTEQEKDIIYLPVACLAKTKSAKRLISIAWDDIHTFKERWANLSNNLELSTSQSLEKKLTI